MTSEIIYQGKLRTQAVHLKSSTEIITDAPVDNQGNGQAFSPTDLVATALASCALTIMGIAANNHDINMDGTKARVLKIMGSNPRRISEVQIDFDLTNRTYTSKEKKILQQAAITCPVAKSLDSTLVQQMKFHW